MSAPRRSASDAVAHAVTLADLRAVRPGLGTLGRWRVRRALAAAARELGLALPSDPSVAHVAAPAPIDATVTLLQTAWLRLHRITVPPSLGLRQATQDLFYAERDRRAARRPARRLVIAGGVAAAVTVVVVALVVARGADAPPPFIRDAGPLADLGAERETAWVEALTDWVIALDRLARARFEGELPTRLEERERNLRLHRESVLAEDLRARFGDEVMLALGAMLDAAEAATSGARGWEKRGEALAEAVRATNRALIAQGFGYFFDSYAVRYDDGRAEAAFYTFRVTDSARYLAPDAAIDALHLRRLDRLNIVQFLLGYTSKHMDVAVLLVDKLEGEVATRLGPALEPGREMPLHMNDEHEGETAWLEVRKKAGTVVREAFYGAMPGEQQALSEIGGLFARRNDLVDDWNSRLEGRYTLNELDTLVIPKDQRDRFEAATSREARLVLDDIQRRLETDDMRALFRRLVARHTHPVELHEVQHRIDYASGDAFEVPEALLAKLGIAPDDAEHEDVRRIAYELSAYTAELARDPEWARVNLTLLAEHLYDGSGGAEGWCAVMILEGLGAQLGIAFDPLLRGGNGADLEVVAALHLKLLERPGAALSAAAGALWEAWFGAPLARLDADMKRVTQPHP